MPQNTDERNPAPKATQAEDCPPGNKSGTDDFDPRPDLDGKTDSGPEPDVHSGN